MSDRDELARALHKACGCDDWRPGDSHDTQYDDMALELWSAGWRKKPSREQVVHALNAVSFEDGQGFGSGRTLVVEMVEAADAILALLDGPTETGGK